MREGQLLRVEPAGVIGHPNHPWVTVKEKLAFLESVGKATPYWLGTS